MDSVSLAEPRRRQKWTLNPRGNLWANDESKFGQKLMEKMGWEKGKGLGAKGDGMTQHISLKLKDNNKGIGFDGHDDTWLAHQNDFQSVLAALNIEHGEAGKDLSETEKKANLEELSKKSRRRVHYQKFVRGKDTNNYSVEDLGCILGTKSEKVKSISAPSSPKPDDDKQDEAEKEDKRFVSGGSYADYFAKKMAELKAKGKFSSVPTSRWTSTQSASCDNDDDNDVQRIGFSGTEETDQPIKKKKKSKKSEAETVETTENIVEEDEDNSEVVKKKKKKSKKRDASPVIDEVTESLNVPASIEENLQPEKKKKKKSKKEKPEEDVTVEEESPVVDEEIATKKKKSKKEKKDIEEVPITEEVVPQEKKKKSKKNKKVISEIENNEVPHPPETACEEGKKKKSKKSKKQKEVEETSPVEEDSGCENEDTKYKKAKKGKKEKTKEKKTTYSDEEKENRRKRKSESEENIAQSDKKLKIDDENQNDTKFAGFKGSNLLSITGYGV